ncbi:choline transporter-like protein 1 [Liolophura sinensis]|uniref:choline transporter-like protein 1 n=1 Tax=Liolophura sinensis TaxID=3198878 RepID=UPI0031582EFC
MCGCCGDSDVEEKANLSTRVKNRGCTDIVFLFVFVAFWVGMIYIAVFSISNGDAMRLVYGYDSYGNTCDELNNPIPNVTLSGQNMKGRPYVFFMNGYNPESSKAVCVAVCPDQQLDFQENVQAFSMRTGYGLCDYDIPVDDYTTGGWRDESCPSLPVPASVPVLNRCVPKEIPKQFIDFLNKSDIFAKILGDLYRSWREMVALCFIALAVAFLMVLVLRFLASVIVWAILGIAVLASVVGTAFLWWMYASPSKTVQDSSQNIILLDVDIYSQKAFLAYSIIATILTVILLLVIFVLRKRIALTVALFHEAGKCLASIPCLLFQPLWTFVVLFLFLIYWTVVLAYLSTAEYPSVNGHGLVKYEEHNMVSYFWWYHVIGLIWSSEFIIACQQFVVSGTVASWYFAAEKNEVNSCAICGSVKNLFFHMGSIAAGSFIITLVKFPRMLLMYLQKKFKGKENACAKYCLKCCSCCLWCLEKCLKFLHANAYTYIAIRGTNFCSSARKAFTTIVNNALRVAAINSIGDFVLFLGKIGVAAATGAIAIVWLKKKDDLHFFAIPVLLVVVFAYFIAKCFLSVYEMVVDALLLCFCEDTEMNDGSPEKPYSMDTSLMKFVTSSSKRLDHLRKPDPEASEEESEPARV